MVAEFLLRGAILVKFHLSDTNPWGDVPFSNPLTNGRLRHMLPLGLTSNYPIKITHSIILRSTVSCLC